MGEFFVALITGTLVVFLLIVIAARTEFIKKLTYETHTRADIVLRIVVTSIITIGVIIFILVWRLEIK